MAPPRKPAAGSAKPAGDDHHKTAGAGGPGGGGVDAETGAKMSATPDAPPTHDPAAGQGGTGYATSGAAKGSAGGATRSGAGAADPLRQAGGKMLESGSAIGAKVIDQAEENARQAFGAMRAAAGAKDLTEVMRIQGDYLRDQGNRSMAQAREIGELIMQFGRDAVTPLRGK